MSKKYLPKILFISLLINIVFGAAILKLNLKNKAPAAVKIAATSQNTEANKAIFGEINPSAGYEINAAYGDLGPRMVASGVIDMNKFKPTGYEEILTKGSTQKIKITTENSYFLLNFFWAVGLNNKSRILTAGDLVKYGGEKDLGNFASTGGWTLGKSDAMNYYSQTALINLTPQQEELVQTVAGNIYRPCCNNPTSFPDCNHGMALLGVLELMSANGADQDQMFEAAKYFNAFWFPNNYYDLATYFKNKEGKNFKDINSRLLLSKDYSSATGYQTAKQWLIDNGFVKEPPKSGGGCGV